MKHQMEKVMGILSIAGVLNIFAVGCSSAPASGTSANQVIELPSPANPENMENSETTIIPNEKPTEDTAEKWHVLPPEIAAVIDADFNGTVWKTESDSFYIVESFTEILDDGSIVESSPSPTADIPESELIQVVHDENTHFYMRTILNGGESYEDTEAAFQDITKHMTVEMKGRFENDIFYADEIRIVKVC